MKYTGVKPDRDSSDYMKMVWLFRKIRDASEKDPATEFRVSRSSKGGPKIINFPVTGRRFYFDEKDRLFRVVTEERRPTSDRYD